MVVAVAVGILNVTPGGWRPLSVSGIRNPTLRSSKLTFLRECRTLASLIPTDAAKVRDFPYLSGYETSIGGSDKHTESLMEFVW